MLHNSFLLFGGGDDKKDVSLGEYINGHADPMSPYIFGVHLPHFELPSVLSFLNNAVLNGKPVFQLTGTIVAMLISALILILFLAMIRRKDGSLSRIGHAIEALVIFVRDDIAIANIGDRLGRVFTPFLCTVFFFILIMNFFSLVPGSVASTANIMVTAALAVTVLIIIEVTSLKELGLKHYLLHLTAGTPVALWIILVPIEIVSKFAKPFALAMRLFANMTAGHIIIFALLGLIGTFGSYAVAGVSVPMALFVYCLECLVAFLQAFIFTLLTALFIGLATAHEEHHEDEEHALNEAH